MKFILLDVCVCNIKIEVETSCRSKSESEHMGGLFRFLINCILQYIFVWENDLIWLFFWWAAASVVQFLASIRSSLYILRKGKSIVEMGIQGSNQICELNNWLLLHNIDAYFNDRLNGKYCRYLKDTNNKMCLKLKYNNKR